MSAWMAEHDTDPYEDQIESAQPRLRAFVLSMMGRSEDVSDIVQETNHVLWRKREDFEAGTNFWAWASKIAFFQIMAHRKKRSRDRHVFCDELLHLMADEVAAHRALPATDHSKALEDCISRLPDRQQQAVRLRYFENQSVTKISQSLKTNENAISQLLFRARASLKKCIEKSISQS